MKIVPCNATKKAILCALALSLSTQISSAQTPAVTVDSSDTLPSEPGAASQRTPAVSEPPPNSVVKKEDEVAQLKAELQQAEDELRQIKNQNQNLKSQNEELSSKANSAQVKAQQAEEKLPVELRQPPPPLASLIPSLAANQPVSARDLSWYFKNDNGEALSTFQKKKLRVNGVLEGCSTGLMTHSFKLDLETGDRSTKVTCEFRIPTVYATIYLKRERATVYGRTADGREDPLLKLGDILTVEGLCNGHLSGYVELNASRLIL